MPLDRTETVIANTWEEYIELYAQTEEARDVSLFQKSKTHCEKDSHDTPRQLSLQPNHGGQVRQFCFYCFLYCIRNLPMQARF